MFIVFVCKQNNRGSGISHLDCLWVGLTAGTYRNSEYRKIMFFSLIVLYAALLPDLYFWSKSCVLYSDFYGTHFKGIWRNCFPGIEACGGN